MSQKTAKIILRCGPVNEMCCCVTECFFFLLFDSILSPKQTAKSADMLGKKTACVMSYRCTDTEAMHVRVHYYKLVLGGCWQC